MIESAGILLESNGKFLLGHPYKGKGWGIPKGKAEQGESYYQAAIREFKEETDFDILENSVIATEYVFTFPVGKKKVVYVFYAQSKTAKDFNFKCNSMIDGTDKPEFDKFYWATPEEATQMVTDSQKEMFERIAHGHFKRTEAV